jgi:hypothetical protein
MVQKNGYWKTKPCGRQGNVSVDLHIKRAWQNKAFLLVCAKEMPC